MLLFVQQAVHGLKLLILISQRARDWCF